MSFCATNDNSSTSTACGAAAMMCSTMDNSTNGNDTTSRGCSSRSTLRNILRDELADVNTMLFDDINDDDSLMQLCAGGGVGADASSASFLPAHMQDSDNNMLTAFDLFDYEEDVAAADESHQQPSSENLNGVITQQQQQNGKESNRASNGSTTAPLLFSLGIQNPSTQQGCAGQPNQYSHHPCSPLKKSSIPNGVVYENEGPMSPSSYIFAALKKNKNKSVSTTATAGLFPNAFGTQGGTMHESANNSSLMQMLRQGAFKKNVSLFDKPMINRGGGGTNPPRSSAMPFDLNPRPFRTTPARPSPSVQAAEPQEQLTTTAPQQQQQQRLIKPREAFAQMMKQGSVLFDLPSLDDDLMMPSATSRPNTSTAPSMSAMPTSLSASQDNVSLPTPRASPKQPASSSASAFGMMMMPPLPATPTQQQMMMQQAASANTSPVQSSSVSQPQPQTAAVVKASPPTLPTLPFVIKQKAYTGKLLHQLCAYGLKPNAGGSDGNNLKKKDTLIRSVERILKIDPTSICRPHVVQIVKEVWDPKAQKMAARKTKAPFRYPLHLAISNKDTPSEVVSILLHHADKVYNSMKNTNNGSNKKNPTSGAVDALTLTDGPMMETPLLLSLRRRPDQDVKLLDELMLIRPASVQVRDRHGNSIVHVACQYGCDIDHVRHLTIMTPEALFQVNVHGKTPIDVAQERWSMCSKSLSNAVDTPSTDQARDRQDDIVQHLVDTAERFQQQRRGRNLLDL